VHPRLASVGQIGRNGRNPPVVVDSGQSGQSGHGTPGWPGAGPEHADDAPCREFSEPPSVGGELEL
jgi:hypothetical protein